MFRNLILNSSFLVFSDSEIPLDTQIPSTEVLVKALGVIASSALLNAPSLCLQVILCTHHPVIIGSGSRDSVWKVCA